MSRVGSDIKRLRTEKGITQKQLGRLVGVAESFIIEVESGKKVIGDNLLTRVYKALGQELGDKNIDAENEKAIGKDGPQKSPRPAPKPVTEIWSDAFDSILKTVPVYDYKMEKTPEVKKMPVIDNKIEGYPKDKVFYLRIEEDDMSGFRIVKGDLALAFSTQEVERDAIYLIEHNKVRIIRQIKRLDGSKVLLVGNKGSLNTETAPLKDVKVIARLIRLEIAL